MRAPERTGEGSALLKLKLSGRSRSKRSFCLPELTFCVWRVFSRSASSLELSSRGPDLVEKVLELGKQDPAILASYLFNTTAYHERNDIAIFKQRPLRAIIIIVITIIIIRLLMAQRRSSCGLIAGQLSPAPAKTNLDSWLARWLAGRRFQSRSVAVKFAATVQAQFGARIAQQERQLAMESLGFIHYKMSSPGFSRNLLVLPAEHNGWWLLRPPKRRPGYVYRAAGLYASVWANRTCLASSFTWLMGGSGATGRWAEGAARPEKLSSGSRLSVLDVEHYFALD